MQLLILGSFYPTFIKLSPNFSERVFTMTTIAVYTKHSVVFTVNEHRAKLFRAHYFRLFDGKVEQLDALPDGAELKKVYWHYNPNELGLPIVIIAMAQTQASGCVVSASISSCAMFRTSSSRKHP